MNQVTLFLLISILIPSALTLDFAFKLPRNKQECFSEPLNPGTLVKGSFVCEEPDYDELSVEIYNSAGKPVLNEPLTGAVIKFSYTTVEEGNTNICIQNTGKKYIKINLELLTGLDAGDISQAASGADLKPVENGLAVIHKMIESIKMTTSFIVNHAEEKITDSDTITTKLYIFSVITVIVVIAVSLFQAKYLERLFRAKKLI